MTATTTSARGSGLLARLGIVIPQVGLAALFVYAGASKWSDPGGFAQEIANFQLWPALAPYLAAVLPAMEIVAGVVLLVGPGPRWRQAAAAAIFAILTLFTIAVTLAAARGLDISCGCFGTDSARVTWRTVIRNLGLLVVAGVLVGRLGMRAAVPGGPDGSALPAASS